MTQAEAADLIKGMADSLDDEPGQFQFAVTMSAAGAIGIGGAGGAGIEATATGGAPGSRTTGFESKVSISGADIHIARQTADDAIRQRISEWSLGLRGIAEELRKEAPDRSRVNQLWDTLKRQLLPGVLTSVIGNVLTLLGRRLV